MLSGEICAPVILDALQRDRAAGDEFLDPVGPEPSGFSSVVAEMSRLRPSRSVPSHQCFGSTVSCADDGRQFAIAGRVEGEFDVAFAGLLGLDDVPIIGANTSDCIS